MLVLVGFTAGIVSPRASCSFVCTQVGRAGVFLAKLGEVVWPGLSPLVPPAPHLFWPHSCLQSAFHPKQNRSSCCPAPKAAMAHGPLPYGSLKLIPRAARARYAPVMGVACTAALELELVQELVWTTGSGSMSVRQRFCRCPDRHSPRCISWWTPAQLHSSLSQAAPGNRAAPDAAPSCAGLARPASPSRCTAVAVLITTHGDCPPQTPVVPGCAPPWRAQVERAVVGTTPRALRRPDGAPALDRRVQVDRDWTGHARKVDTGLAMLCQKGGYQAVYPLTGGGGGGGGGRRRTVYLRDVYACLCCVVLHND